jgi:hypothetical protein
MKPRLNYDTFVAIIRLETNEGIDQCQLISYSSAKIATVLERYDTATMVAQKVHHTHVNVVKVRASNGLATTTLAGAIYC